MSLIKSVWWLSILFLLLGQTETHAQSYRLRNVTQLPGNLIKDVQARDGKLFSVDHRIWIQNFSDSGTFLSRRTFPESPIWLNNYSIWDNYSYPFFSLGNGGKICLWQYTMNDCGFCGLGCHSADRRTAWQFQSTGQATKLFLYPSEYAFDPGGPYLYQPKESFSFSRSGKLVSSGFRVLPQTNDPYFIQEVGFIQMRGTDSTRKWRKDLTGVRSENHIRLCHDRGDTIRAYISSGDTFKIDNHQVEMTWNKYAQIRLDTNGTLQPIKIHTYTFPNSTLYPVADRGVVEVSSWSDSLPNGTLKKGIRLVMKDKESVLSWERKIETPGQITGDLVDFEADSVGILIAISSGINVGNSMRGPFKFQIADLDYSGNFRFIDSSLTVSTLSENYYNLVFLPQLARIDSNRFTVSVISDSAMGFQNQTFHASGTAETSYDSWLLYLDRRQTQEVPVYRLETRLCGQDSLRIPVLGFPEGPDQFRVELSDSSGSFTHPVVLATDSSRNLLIRFPSGLPDGDSYALRVFSVSQQKYSSSYRIKIQFRSHIPAPVITALGSTQFCAGKSVKLVAESPYPTRWEGGYYTNSDTLEVQYSTQVRAIAQFGSCSASTAPIQTRAIQHHVLLPNLLEQPLCLPYSYPITLNRIDTGAYWYGQYVDSASQSFVPGTADTSILHYRNHRNPACLADTSFTVRQIEKPWLPPLRDSIVCLGSTLNLKRHFLPNSVWTGLGLVDSVFTPTSPGKYNFYGSRSEGGCTSYSSPQIHVPDSSLFICQQLDTLPEMGIAFSGRLCAGNSVTAYIKNQLFWIHPNAQLTLEGRIVGSTGQVRTLGISNSGPVINLNLPYNFLTGNYKFQLRCSNPDTIFDFSNQIFKIRKAPTGYPVIHWTGPSHYCEGSGPVTTLFYINGVYPALWSSDNFQIISDTLHPIPGKTYMVQLSNEGCVGGQGVGFTFLVIPKQTAILNSSVNICVPTPPIQLSTNSFAGVWSGPYLNVPNGRFSPPNVNDSVVVGYKARYGPSNVCQVDTHFVFTLRKKPEIPAVKDTFACRSAGAFTLPYGQWQSQWSGPGLVNGPAYLPPAGHNFDTLKVVATHEFCSATGSLRIQVRDSLDPSCPTVGIKSLTGTGDEISVYPNPSQGRFTVVLPERKVRERFKIRDGFGRDVFESEPGTQEVDLRELAAGRYWICLPGIRAKAVEIR